MEHLGGKHDQNFRQGNLHHLNMRGSSGLDAAGVFDSDDEENQFRRVTDYQWVDRIAPFPPFTKRKEDVDIKDMLKDHVLTFLPAKSLIRFRSVSKDWDHRIRSPFLAHQQSYSFQGLSGYFCQPHNHSSPTFVSLDHAAYGVPMPSLEFLSAPVCIRSSSNGLLLCEGYTEWICSNDSPFCQDRMENKTYYVCNPVTKEWMELPEPKYYGSEASLVLAFDPSVLNMGAHYQVICAIRLHDQPVVCFELYSSQTKSWKHLDAICVELGDSSFVGDGLYMNGIAYWQTSTGKVLAFDLKYKVHGVIPLPNERPPGGVLAKIDGKLAHIGIDDDWAQGCCLKIYGVGDLSLRQRIDMELEPVTWGINGYRVLPSVDGHSDDIMILGGGLLYSYDLKTQRKKVVNCVEGIKDLATARFLPYVNSLVSVA